ncbi:hypothetical protein C8T65DRAFT_726339 [Cerioporus squamosus]|nr:hypothetical protein C8T65DRAFT_726339 [Cerioporus squamosus]
MSTVHMSYDDYGYPHTVSPNRLLYPPSHLDASTSSSSHPGLLSSHLPPDPTYSAYFPTQHDHFVAQQYLSGVGNALLDHHANVPLYSAAALRPPSHPMYDAGRPSSSEPSYAPPAPEWNGNAPPAPEWNGNVPYPAHYDPVGSAAAYVRGLTDIIDSSHTVQSQQAALVPQLPEQQHLSGSLDPTTGEFHRTVEHPRLRTAQACEKCRIRKAKCTGETPCSRCLSRGLQCEYAPERKMRGPNKNKRGDGSPKSPAKAKPRKRKDDAFESLDSASDGNASDNPPSPPDLPSESSSAHSSPVPPPRLIPPHLLGRRPRAATMGLGAIGRLSEFNSPAAGPSSAYQPVASAARPRPPPLNLASAREYVPRMLAQYNGAPEVVPLPEESHNPRPTSLPSYLIDSYSRIALGNPGEDASSQSSDYDSRPPSQGMGNFLSDSPASVFSHSRTSSSDMSAPISPISLNFESEFQYSDHIPSDFGHFGDAGPPEHPFGGDMHMYAPHDELLRPKSAQGMVHHGWHAALSSDDRTPRGLDDANMLVYP